ncbi:PREDICTED: isochorismatase domain-containing protein 2-like [Dufourea novaeangliae]|uniref:Isochorismatase domain-containing protein 1 n=1 Tax=Dufourea novaeangliae TaxID=178035 RepID=A0A154P7E5_DUFNO|nr:PREDICTED: isochorismatase domain-containing protein 2-like [Dufourea novaeangliae]KZC07118.1 Isochorismatase domain-containing protein 2, mitochondrial [Dufourea novaeangliae]
MAINPAKAILKEGKCALLICDVQVMFAKDMLEFNKIVQNSIKLMNALKLLEVPMLVSEHTGWGKTIPEFDISGAKGPFAKTQFSMCTPEITNELSTICSGKKPEAIILIGVETHVCIESTAIDLRVSGYEVHVVADCCTTRTQEDRLLAFERMRDIGCHITTSENVIFKILGNTTRKEFTDIDRLVQTPTLDTGLTSKK